MTDPVLTLDAERDTFPKLVRANARARGQAIAIREKDYGIWQAYTWAQYFEQARLIALGLASLGLARGDKVAIVGDNRPQLYWAVMGAQALGGVPVPLYQDSVEKELAYIADHAEVRFAVVEDQEQVDKLLHVRAQCPRLETIVYDDPRGMRGYAEPFLLSLEELQRRGRAFGEDHPRHFDDEVAQGRADDLAVMCYTSGTTGAPKGTMLSHRNLLFTATNAARREGLGADDEVLAYLPMAWVGDHVFSYAQAIVTGFTVNCPESAATVLADLKEIGPTYFFAPPRIWESILTTVMIRVEDCAWPKRRMVHFFLDLAQDMERRRLSGRGVAPVQRLLYPLGRLLVYGPLRDNLGFRRIRVAYTAGEAIGPEIFVFFRSLGINVKQLYGMTESSGLIAIQRDGEVRLDSVGTPLPGVEIRISDEGEVLFRSPGVFRGYYKNPEATERTVRDGWVHTGDAGFIDGAGDLRIVDRAKDVSRLADGTMFAPKYLENKLKFSPYVKEAVCVGQDRPFVAALLNIDLAAVGNWAERRGITHTSYTDLSQKPEVYELVGREVARVNATLLDDEVLRGARIKRFLILHKELDPDDEEVTRTRKVRRGYIAQKYAGLIEALYGSGDHVEVEAKVTYEDGRVGMIRADVRIRDAEVVAAGSGR
ncbi:MAG: AMP-binding protein [Candidatus Rokubacteria bacterium]|nr:AMP-binding protein [Candidatus Rokubacteria bacterium]MBI3827620.1 AMP-binding protein [Candidatus Rokubacteria bacterium]